jgi:hypothetical protein
MSRRTIEPEPPGGRAPAVRTQFSTGAAKYIEFLVFGLVTASFIYTEFLQGR